jgi:PAS domain S-box-containing protein
MIVDCNLAFTRIHGFRTSNEVMGKPVPGFFERLHPGSAKAVEQFIRSSYIVRDVETHELGKDGVSRWYSTSAHGIVENGLLRRMWGVQREITDQKVSEQMRDELLARLTPRQVQILRLTTEGRSLKETSMALGIDSKTVETHRLRLMRKLGIHDIPTLVVKSIRFGLIDM